MSSRHNIAMTWGDEGEPSEPSMAAADQPLRSPPQHRLTVLSRYSRWRAMCLCGWQGRLQGSPDEARTSWLRHIRETREDDE